MGFDDEGKLAMVEEDIEDDEDDGLEHHKRVCYLIPIISALCNFHRNKKINFHKSNNNNGIKM